VSDKPVLVYGAGIYAYVLHQFLASNRIPVAAAMVDSTYKKTDIFMGLNLVTTEEFADQLVNYHVIVGVTNYPPAMRKLKTLGAIDIHVIDIPDYLNMPSRFMNIEFFRKNIEQFDQAVNLFADTLSRETYIAAINTKISEDLSFIDPYVRLDNIYFPATEFPVHLDEVFLDVGGFTGDTIREFHEHTKGQYTKIISLEPSPENYATLLESLSELGLTNVVPIKIGAWDQRATLRFTPKAMRIDNQITNDGELKIEVDTIDSILQDRSDSVTLMKLDINGAEYRALSGASNTIKKCRPRIVVRLHTKEDFFRLPILLKTIAPDIKLFLRQRSYMSMMVILYGTFESNL
jgi:FkbM family methyltransferase